MKRFRFHPEAPQEADQAALFYRTKQDGLDMRFLDALEDAIARIRRNPKPYRIVDEGRGIRKCRLSRFPYGVIFRESGAYVDIIAVMHLKRPPGYWKRRS